MTEDTTSQDLPEEALPEGGERTEDAPRDTAAPGPEAGEEAPEPEGPAADGVAPSPEAENGPAPEGEEMPEVPPLDLAQLSGHVEAIVFTSEQPVAVADVTGALNRAHGLELDPNVVRNHLDDLLEKYADDRYPFRIVESGGGYRFMSKEAYHQTISHFLNLKSRRRLSTAAMETLAIIAYRQPVSKPEVENIRGVNCDYSIQKLLEKELIEIAGRADTPGKPLLYATSAAFMDHFGINSVDELPKLKEFEQAGQELGISPEALDPEQLSGEAPMPERAAADAASPDVFADDGEVPAEAAAPEDGAEPIAETDPGAEAPDPNTEPDGGREQSPEAEAEGPQGAAAAGTPDRQDDAEGQADAEEGAGEGEDPRG